MFHLPAVLFAAIDTGTWSLEQARAWADGVIAQVQAPAAWLMKLSVASTTNEATDSVMQRFKERGIVLPDDLGELLAGLLYLRFQRGDLPWRQFEAEMADMLDSSGALALDVEAWTEQMKASSGEIPPSLKLALEHMAGRSAEALDELETIDSLRSDGFFSDR